MKSIGELVRDALHRFESQRKLHLQHAREVWREVVPDTYEDHTSVQSYRDGVLKIGVSSQPMLSELSNFHADQLRASLQEGGLESLEKLTFTAV